MLKGVNLFIGSNKPSQKERLETVHHLIDFCDPHETYSCGDFVLQASDSIRDIISRGKIPIVVGGLIF